MSYRKLEIWKIAQELVIDIHIMTINNLPKFELYEVKYVRENVEFISTNRK